VEDSKSGSKRHGPRLLLGSHEDKIDRRSRQGVHLGGGVFQISTCDASDEKDGFGRAILLKMANGDF
jgi:hypothetical protein